jgi:hypothetical protein
VVVGDAQVVQAGDAGDVQIGRPSGRMTAWTLAPKSRCFPEYQASIVSRFTLVVVSAHRSVVKTRRRG